jgi:hypothetical protein
MELFYKHGTPTDIIYNGKHARFCKKLCDYNKYVWVSAIDSIEFIHDGGHIIAKLEDTELTVWTCKERMENKHLHGPGTAIPRQPETSPLS